MTKEYKDINESKKETVYNIEGVEIFKTGTWNGDKYSEKDIEELEASFKEIGNSIKPYLKLGHNNKQELLKSDGMPAAGWVTNVRKEGKSLLADFINIPKKIYTLIKNKQYGRMSSEIYWNLKSDGKTYRRVLKAVALLGADTPAVQTLDDFINLYTEENIECETIKEYHNITKEPGMETKIYEDRIQELESKLAVYSDLEKSYTELESKVKSYTDEIESLKLHSAKLELDKKKESVKNRIGDKVKEGKILPSQVEMYTQIAMEEKLYTIGEKEVSALEFVESLVDTYGKQVDFKEESKEGEKPKFEEEEDKLYSKALEYSKSNDIPFKEAYIIIEKQEVE